MGNYQQAVVPMLVVPSLYISGAKAVEGRLDSRATAIVAVRCSFGRDEIYIYIYTLSSLALTNSHFVVRDIMSELPNGGSFDFDREKLLERWTRKGKERKLSRSRGMDKMR